MIRCAANCKKLSKGKVEAFECQKKCNCHHQKMPVLQKCPQKCEPGKAGEKCQKWCQHHKRCVVEIAACNTLCAPTDVKCHNKCKKSCHHAGVKKSVVKFGSEWWNEMTGKPTGAVVPVFGSPALEKPTGHNSQILSPLGKN